MKMRLAALATFVLFAACTVASSHPAHTLYDDLTHQSACYERTYDAAHLAAHPRQTVTRFFIGEPGAEWRPTQSPGHFNVAFGFQIVGHSDTYAGVGICTPNGEAVACDIEGDGGSFTVSRNGDGLRVVAVRIQAEGASDFSPNLAEADNRVMLLRPSAAQECSAS